MRTLVIPDQQLNGLRNLVSLADDQFAKVLKTIDSAGSTVTYSKLASLLVEEAKLSRSRASNILGLFIALHELSQEGPVLPAEIAHDVSEVMRNKQKLSEEEASLVRTRINDALNKTETLAILAKATSLLTENQRTFLECRILSDIRAIYSGSPESPPAAAVLLHTLKLVYQNNFQKEEFFVTLDTADLKSLKAALERAELKATGLKKIINNAGLRYIDLSEE